VNTKAPRALLSGGAVRAVDDRLIARFGGALDTSQVRSALAKIESTLHELEESIESHMTRGLTMLSNAVQNQRLGIAECRSQVAALRARDEAMALHDPGGMTERDTSRGDLMKS
jgi:hypothetical protein